MKLQRLNKTCISEKTRETKNIKDNRMDTQTIPVKSVDGKFAGSIKGNIYTKYVDTRKHQLLKPAAWCIDKHAFDKLIKPSGVRLIRFVDLNAGFTWEVYLGVFDKNKGEIDWKYGTQYFLILEHWKKI